MSPQSSPSEHNTENTKPNRWYLAYGGNLSTKTFRGRRGIRPLDQANVAVPSLELTFDLPGIPYWEPCFANVRVRADDGRGKDDSRTGFELNGKMDFRRVLMGVAYLVSHEDYTRIIATEVSYIEKEVECWRVDSSDAGKTKDERRIMATTLIVRDSARRSLPMQPSRRYMALVRAGARAFHVPTAQYISYLDGIRSYHRKSLRQRIGGPLFLFAWSLPLAAVILMNVAFTNRKSGYRPPWVSTINGTMRSIMWKIYGIFWRRIFGSGEVADSRDAGWHPNETETIEEEEAGEDSKDA